MTTPGGVNIAVPGDSKGTTVGRRALASHAWRPQPDPLTRSPTWSYVVTKRVRPQYHDVHLNGGTSVYPFPPPSIRFMMQVGKQETPVPEGEQFMEDRAC
jgi:hypothetical protein